MRRGHFALLTMIAFGSVACGTSDQGGTGPQVPGSLTVATETSGFQQDDSYELLVNGEAAGSIGANDEIMVSDLDPATYELDLSDVASNCTVQSTTTATVVSAQTAVASLTITCAPAEPTAYSIRANRDRPDLETGALTECSFGLCPTNQGWDLYVLFDSSKDPEAVIHLNTVAAVEMAHVPGKTLSTLTEADVSGATFSTDFVNESFDSGRVILIRTDTGSVYALGNPVESTVLLTLAFDAVLLSAGS